MVDPTPTTTRAARTARAKAMFGHRVRRLRREQGLSQADMAARLGISASYLNLIEHNQRPLTVPLLLRLGQAFDVDLVAFSGEDEEGGLQAGLRAVFAERLFEPGEVSAQDLLELSESLPGVARAVLRLHQSWRAARGDLEALAERVAERGGDGPGAHAFPVEEVRDLFQAQGNHFPELERAAEAFRARARLDQTRLWEGLSAAIAAELDFKTRILPAEVLGDAVRRLDRHGRRILLSDALPPPSRLFQLAHQWALLAEGDLLTATLARHAVASRAGRLLARAGLANYLAAAVLLPYEPFLEAARETRHDLDRLRHRFGASFEQVCHRLTTLGRPGARGIPFFLLRVDRAGNVSKRYAGPAPEFVRTGGDCPRFGVYEAFRAPGTIQRQLAALPDGSLWFTVARTVLKPPPRHGVPPQEYALALGCDPAHAGALVYADGLDLRNPAAAVPVGPTCRLCDRLDCAQRAFPPLHRRVEPDEQVRGPSPLTGLPPLGDSAGGR